VKSSNGGLKNGNERAETEKAGTEMSPKVKNPKGGLKNVNVTEEQICSPCVDSTEVSERKGEGNRTGHGDKEEGF
jgi:hypothetical protein